jgi:hypothetical protein
MPILNLRKFAIENIQKVSSKSYIAKEEYRMVNGLKVLYLEMNATVEGVDVIYMNYYYSDSATTIQFLTYAPKLLGATFKMAGTELLNGLCIADENNRSAENAASNIQSSMDANSNCKKMLKGSWSYIGNGMKYVDRYEPGKMIENPAGNKYKSIYQMTWTDSCHYELKVLSSNDPAMKLFKIGSILYVEVLSIDDKKMRFAITYAGKTNTGELTREN